MSGKALAAGIVAHPEPVASAIPLTYFSNDAYGVDAGEIRPFVQVTPRAGKCQVGGFGQTAVLLRGDVFDMESQPRHRLWQPAVFASVVGPSSNLEVQVLVHVISEIGGLWTVTD